MTNRTSMTNGTTRPFAVHGRSIYSAALVGAAALLGGSGACRMSSTTTNNQAVVMQHAQAGAMQLTQEWDKTFPKSDRVDHRKVTFKNRYGITLAGDLYVPKNRAGNRLAALAVSGP